MPLFEYECDSHGHRFEIIQKHWDSPIDVCPTCGGPVHKLFSSPAIQFKGAGWYVTDYARKGQSPDSGGASAARGKDGKSSPSSSSSSSGPAEKTPAGSSSKDS
jgi:putative FmdB family regulatory protein